MSSHTQLQISGKFSQPPGEIQLDINMLESLWEIMS